MNLSKKYPRVYEEGEVAELGSFFNFFEHTEDPTDVSYFRNSIFKAARRRRAN